MPKVLRIINRLNLGGPTFNAALLTKYMAPEFETLLVAGTRMDTEESSEFICEDLGIDFVRLPEMSREISFSKDRAAYRKIKSLIAQFKPDIVHTHAAKAGTLGRIAAWSMKVPVIVHTFHGHVFHSYFNPVKTRIFLQIERYLARKSSAIVAISDFQKEELAKKFKVCEEKKIHVIPLGFDLNKFMLDQKEKRKQFRNKYMLDDDEIAVGIVGRLVPVKNHAMFLRIFKKILNRTTQRVRAFVIGDGEELENLFEHCRSLNVDFTFFPENPRRATLTFSSWIKEVDIALAGLDIVALTSFNEGTPVSLIEAQAAEKPIVATNVGGIENVVVKNVTAFLSESMDEETFTKQLLTLIEDGNTRMEMTRQSRSQVESRFHYKRLVNDMKMLYNELLR